MDTTIEGQRAKTDVVGRRARWLGDVNPRMVGGGVAGAVMGLAIWIRISSVPLSSTVLALHGLALLLLGGGVGQAVAGLLWRDRVPVACRRCRREVVGLHARWGTFCAEGGHYARVSGSRIAAPLVLALVVLSLVVLVIAKA